MLPDPWKRQNPPGVAGFIESADLGGQHVEDTTFEAAFKSAMAAMAHFHDGTATVGELTRARIGLYPARFRKETEAWTRAVMRGLANARHRVILRQRGAEALRRRPWSDGGPLDAV